MNRGIEQTLLCVRLPGPIQHCLRLLDRDLRCWYFSPRLLKCQLWHLCLRASLPRAPWSVSLYRLSLEVILRSTSISIITPFLTFRTNSRTRRLLFIPPQPVQDNFSLDDQAYHNHSNSPHHASLQKQQP